MSGAAPALVAAAGGVLWRPAGDGIEVALVHRPRYDDWSLPKGKLAPGERPLLGALREVHEETGFTAVAGRTLGTSAYHVPQDGALVPKTVRWWALRAGPGRFEPDEEVDDLVWARPGAAVEQLTAARDLSPLDLLVRSGTGTTTVLLVRHGRAGDRASWPGDDLERPLDERGEAQAATLVPLLQAYAPVRVVSAPALRCVLTVTPLAQELGLPVEVDPAVGEDGHAADPQGSLDLLARLGRLPGASVVCSQGGAIPDLVTQLTRDAGMRFDKVRAKKGSVWALTFKDGRLVDADHVPPGA